MTIWGKIPYHPIAFKKELKIISQYWWYIFLNCHSIRLALLNRLPNMDCAKEYVLQKLILKEMCHAYMFQLQYICILHVSRLFVENPTCSKPKKAEFFHCWKKHLHLIENAWYFYTNKRKCRTKATQLSSTETDVGRHFILQGDLKYNYLNFLSVCNCCRCKMFIEIYKVRFYLHIPKV